MTRNEFPMSHYLNKSDRKKAITEKIKELKDANIAHPEMPEIGINDFEIMRLEELL